MGVYAAKAIGTVDALASRLRSARQRAAGLLNQALRDAERDAVHRAWESPILAAERAVAAEALEALLRRLESQADRAAQAELERTEGLHQMARRRGGRVEEDDLVEPLPVVLTP